MSNLNSKSLTELRSIAQGYGVEDIFKKDVAHLIQAIESKQQAMISTPATHVPKPAYDARLMTKPPAKRTHKEMAEDLMKPYISLGMSFKIDENDERWYMSLGKRSDEGTMRMRPDTLLHCARKVCE